MFRADLELDLLVDEVKVDNLTDKEMPDRLLLSNAEDQLEVSGWVVENIGVVSAVISLETL